MRMKMRVLSVWTLLLYGNIVKPSDNPDSGNTENIPSKITWTILPKKEEHSDLVLSHTQDWYLTKVHCADIEFDCYKAVNLFDQTQQRLIERVTPGTRPRLLDENTVIQISDGQFQYQCYNHEINGFVSPVQLKKMDQTNKPYRWVINSDGLLVILRNKVVMTLDLILGDLCTLQTIFHPSIMNKNGNGNEMVMDLSPNGRWLYHQSGDYLILMDTQNTHLSRQLLIESQNEVIANENETHLLMDWPGYGLFLFDILMNVNTPIHGNIRHSRMIWLTDRVFIFEDKKGRIIARSVANPTRDIPVDPRFNFDLVNVDTQVGPCLFKSRNPGFLIQIGFQF